MGYGGALTEAILRFKHGRERHLARSLGSLLFPIVTSAVQAGVDCLCPVPLHSRRLRDRGFNQSLELLRVARRALSGRPKIELLCNDLRRVRDTPALGRESPSARRRIVAGAFSVADPSRVAGRRILLLDDVMTTGATLAECARVLLRAGAAEVQVAALARAL
jgi:ComF family protein